MDGKPVLQWDRAMFIRSGDTTRNKRQWYRIGQILPILSAKALLSDNRFNHAIEQLKQLSFLPEDHFEDFYSNFIDRFAEFVQALPGDASAPLGNLLTESLLRGLNALHFFVKEFNDSSALERYALFTACVLHDIHSTVTHQKVFVTNQEGITLQIWQPFCGPLTKIGEGQFYKIIPLSSAYHRIGKYLRPVLARQVMEENGYLWLCSDLNILAQWLEVLNEEEGEGNGRLAHAVKRYRQWPNVFPDLFSGIWFDLIEAPSGTEYADQFYQWLVNGLADGSIKVNRSDSFVHMTEIGAFIEFEPLFKVFAEQYSVPLNHVVFTQIGNLLGIARKGGGDYRHVQLYFQIPETAGIAGRNTFASTLANKSSAMRDGFLMNPETLFLNGKPSEVSRFLKIPPTMKQSNALAEFNANKGLNTSMKNR